jgi:hypothetical protein
MIGMVELFLFVKLLEEEFAAVMRGASIEYGATKKTTADVSESRGWPKETKEASKRL